MFDLASVYLNSLVLAQSVEKTLLERELKGEKL